MLTTSSLNDILDFSPHVFYQVKILYMFQSCRLCTFSMTIEDVQWLETTSYAEV